MTFEELGQTLLDLLYAVINGIAAIFRCIGDMMISGAKTDSAGVSINSIKIFSNVTVNRIIFFVILAYILFINTYTFIKFYIDKKHARRKDVRISESNLLLSSFIGGATGAIIGMNVYHHKTLKKKFTVIVTILFIIQLIAYCVAFGFLGFWAFF